MRPFCAFSVKKVCAPATTRAHQPRPRSHIGARTRGSSGRRGLVGGCDHRIAERGADLVEGPGLLAADPVFGNAAAWRIRRRCCGHSLGRGSPEVGRGLVRCAWRCPGLGVETGPGGPKRRGLGTGHWARGLGTGGPGLPILEWAGMSRHCAWDAPSPVQSQWRDRLRGRRQRGSRAGVTVSKGLGAAGR